MFIFKLLEIAPFSQCIFAKKFSLAESIIFVEVCLRYRYMVSFSCNRNHNIFVDIWIGISVKIGEAMSELGLKAKHTRILKMKQMYMDEISKPQLLYQCNSKVGKKRFSSFRLCIYLFHIFGKRKLTQT